MSKTSRVRWSCGLLAASATILLLAGCSGGGGSSTAPTLHPPTINQFVATPTDIAPGDSLQLTYNVTGADSTVLSPPRARLSNPATGAVYVKPAHPVCYILFAYNKDGHDSASLVIPMANSVPTLTAGIDQDTIVQYDSALVTYHAIRADSVVMIGVKKGTSPDSGRIALTPSHDANYSLIAYNAIGTDTSKFKISVEVPQALIAVNGRYYKGTLGSSVVTPALKFICTDAQSDTLRKVWVHFERMYGDGQLSVDSIRPDYTGAVSLSYTFSGTVGHAEILAFVRNAPAGLAYARIRADALIPGQTGQLEYGVMEDSVATLKAFDGTTPGVSTDPRGIPILYLSFAKSPGVVFYVYDHNADFHAEDTEEVVGGAVYGSYAGKTKEGIGIGSSFSDVENAYGRPHEFSYDSTGSQYVASYTLMGVVFLLKPADSTVKEIQFGYPNTRPAPGYGHPPAVAASHDADRPFHLVYFPPN